MIRNYNRKPLRIFIGVGHGGTDSGAVNQALGLNEAAVNLTIAMLMQCELKRHGVQVKLSRETNEEDRLHEEIAECNAYAPDFAVEIHTNAGGGTGFEVYYQLEPWEYTKASLQMATLFDNNVSKYLGVHTRGCKTNASLGWLKQVSAPCILVENFFIDGPNAAWYSAPEQLAKLSKAYVRSILEYYGIAYIPEEAGMLQFHVVTDALQTAQKCSCRAILLNGSHYVHLRQYTKALGLEVHYEEASRKVLIYSPEQYAECAFQNRLLKRSDYPTALEQTLAGILPTDAADAEPAEL